MLFIAGRNTVEAWAKTVNIEDYKAPQLQLQLESNTPCTLGNDLY